MSSNKINNMVAFLQKETASSITKAAEDKKGTPNQQQQPGGDGTVQTSGAQPKKDKDADPVHMDMPKDEKPIESEGKKLEDKDLNPKGIEQPGANKGGEPKGSGLSTKSASKVKDILGRVEAIQKQASAPTPAPEKTQDTPATTTGVDKQAENKGGIQFNTDMMLKLATAMVSTEEGAAEAMNIISKSEGREVAANLIKSAAEQAQENQQRLGYIQQTTELGGQHIVKLAAALDPQLTEDEADFVVKSAAMHADFQNNDAADYSHPLIKQAYAQGMQDAAAMEDAAAAGAEEPSIPGGGEEISPEDIAMVLEMAVQSGELSPEEAEAILMQLAGGGEAAPEGAADPAAEEAAALAGAEGEAAIM